MLAIDIGNSRVKWALFKGEHIHSHGAFAYNHNIFESVLDDSGLVNHLNNVSISCVAGDKIKQRFSCWLTSNGCSVFNFAQTAKQQNGVCNAYSEPSKMGVDRWLAMIAAYRLFDKNSASKIYIIDCGTAITLDVLGSNGKHFGGLILPGYQTMISSLGLSTGNIQSTEVGGLDASLNVGLGVSTDEAVSKGVAQIISSGIGALISEQCRDSDDAFLCVVTGGDGEWLANWLGDNSTSEIKFEPFLVLQGLNFISI